MNPQLTNTNDSIPTTYVLSPFQHSFLLHLKDWISLNPPSLPPSPHVIDHYRSTLLQILENDAYNEEDRYIINHIRSLYIRDMNDSLPF